jgi:glycosyltransferase involved in cell wall biosynthesis
MRDAPVRPRVEAAPLFVHPAIQRYREGLLQALHDELGAHLVFVGYEEHNRSYLAKRELPAHRVLPATALGPYRQGVSWELLRMAFRANYRVWIASNLNAFATHAAAFLVSARRRPFVLFGEDWWWPSGTTGIVAAAIGRAVLRRADAVIAAGSRAARFYLANGARPGSVRVAINACPPPPPAPSELVCDLRQRWRSRDHFIYLFLNRLVDFKGLRVLLKAFRRVLASQPGSVLLAVGDGPERGPCQRLVDELRLTNVHFLGAAPPDSVRAYYEVADVYVHPAITLPKGRVRGDAWGFTINEAMWVGCPVVTTTAVGAADDLIKDRITGRVVPSNDENGLADALLEMQSLPRATREAMALAARAHLESVASVERQAAVFIEAIQGLLERGCGA